MTKVRELLFFEPSKTIKVFGGKKAAIEVSFDRARLALAGIKVKV